MRTASACVRSIHIYTFLTRLVRLDEPARPAPAELRLTQVPDVPGHRGVEELPGRGGLKRPSPLTPRPTGSPFATTVALTSKPETGSMSQPSSGLVFNRRDWPTFRPVLTSCASRFSQTIASVVDGVPAARAPWRRTARRSPWSIEGAVTSAGIVACRARSGGLASVLGWTSRASTSRHPNLCSCRNDRGTRARITTLRSRVQLDAGCSRTDRGPPRPFPPIARRPSWLPTGIPHPGCPAAPGGVPRSVPRPFNRVTLYAQGVLRLSVPKRPAISSTTAATLTSRGDLDRPNRIEAARPRPTQPRSIGVRDASGRFGTASHSGELKRSHALLRLESERFGHQRGVLVSR